LQEREFARNHPQLARVLNLHGFKFDQSFSEPWELIKGGKAARISAPFNSSSKVLYFIGKPLPNREANDFKLLLGDYADLHNDSNNGKFKVHQVSVTSRESREIGKYSLARLVLRLRER
jgi:hypothetical protein